MKSADRFPLPLDYTHLRTLAVYCIYKIAMGNFCFYGDIVIMYFSLGSPDQFPQRQLSTNFY
jgi:hypothetical protein